jgi:hypothetical protein
MGFEKPGDVGVCRKRLFPAEHSDWESYASDSGCLRLRPHIHLCEAGIAGSLSLGNPPSVEEIDAWEASKRAGVWDYYSFLGFSVVPREKLGERELVLFFCRNTFFDRPLEVVATLPVAANNELDYEDDDVILEKEWNAVNACLKQYFGEADLANEVWTVGGKRFTIDDPDG